MVKISIPGVTTDSSSSSSSSAKFWEGGEKNDLCPTMTFQQRVYCFIGCLCLGFMFAIISWIAIFKRNWKLFGICLTASNCVAIGGSMFLAGPMKQLKKMFEETRFIATAVYLVAMIMTVVAAVWIKSVPLVIICCICQYLAMIWYGLSYIPFARAVVKNCCKSFI